MESPPGSLGLPVPFRRFDVSRPAEAVAAAGATFSDSVGAMRHETGNFPRARRFGGWKRSSPGFVGLIVKLNLNMSWFLFPCWF